MPGKAAIKVIQIWQFMPFSDDFKDLKIDAFLNVILTLKWFCNLAILE